jgi:pyruvate dehydrogenase E2 component (dihydrolipoamide acetyltransferase)
MRRTVARRTLESVQTVPHFYLSVDIGMDRLASVRGEANAMAGGAFKLSINDFVIKALAVALQRTPEANAVWAVDRLLMFEHSDVAVAVAVDGGLYTPIIRGAEGKSLSAISSEMKELTERARNRLLKAADYEGGTISVSNLGMYGVRTFWAIVAPPQAAILAVGAVERRPVEGPGGSVGFGAVMSASLSCDHRVIDGALGARLLGAFKELMESPRLLFD